MKISQLSMVIKRNYKRLSVDDKVEVRDYEPLPPSSSHDFRYLDFDMADRTLMIIRM